MNISILFEWLLFLNLIMTNIAIDVQCNLCELIKKSGKMDQIMITSNNNSSSSNNNKLTAVETAQNLHQPLH